jgi:hypothetical protein
MMRRISRGIIMLAVLATTLVAPAPGKEGTVLSS